MGADVGMPGSAGRGNVISSSAVRTIPQYLSLEPISLGSQKYMRSGELRRALGFSSVSASEDPMFRASSFKHAAPIATEDLKQFKDNVVNASTKARWRSKIFRYSIHNIDKYTEAIGSKKRQRTELLSNEKPGGPSLLKTPGHSSRNRFDQSAQRLEDRAKSAGMNKRFRSSTAELMVDSKPGSLAKDQIINQVDTSIQSVGRASVQPEERILRLSAVGEGWDKNMKRKRSIGTVANRPTDNDMKRAMQTKMSTDTKLASCDNSVPRLNGRSNAKQGTSSGSPGTVVKGKSRAPRTGSLVAVNSSDGLAITESCEGWEQPSSASKVVSVGLVQNNHRAATSSHMLGQWVGQRQQKSSRSRRSNVVSPVTNDDEGQILSLNSAPPAIAVRSPLNGNSGAFGSTVIVHNIHSTANTNIKSENTPSPGRLSEVEDILGFENRIEAKGKDSGEVAFNGKGKVHALLIPTKRNKNFLNEIGVDGMRKQGRTVRGLPLSKSGVESEVKLENASTIKRIQNSRHSSEKIRGRTGRPPSKKMSDGKVTRNYAEFVGGSCQNDPGVPQDVTATGAFFDCQYPLMCLYEKLVMELQSIGLYLDAMPDLVEGEVIDRNLTEVKEGLHDQIGKKKQKLVKIDTAVQDDCQRDKRFMEQLAMEQLIQMAYKWRMAYRRNNTSKTVMRKVSKQVAMGFIERSLARVKKFEATGQSCFSEPGLQDVIFAAPQGIDVGIDGAPKQLHNAKSGSVSLSIPDSCVNDFSKGCTDSPQVCHSFEICLGKLESVPHKGKKRELRLDDVGGSFSGATTYGSSLIGGANRKTTESDRDNIKASMMSDTVRENLSVGGFKSEERPRAKSKQKASGARPSSISVQEQSAGSNKRGRETLLSSSSCDGPKDACKISEEPIDFDSIAQDDATAPVDLNDDWFKDLPDGDFAGCLDIPMDDLSMVF